MKSTIQINAARLRHNFAAIREAAGPGCEVLCVIKANAYGHGASLCAPVLVGAGAQWLGVGDLEEGIAVKNSLEAANLGHWSTHVLVMCGFTPGDGEALVFHGLTPSVWTPEHVGELQRAAMAQGRHVAVHIEVDTGMARQGVAPGADLEGLLTALKAADKVNLEGFYSHLSSSEVAGAEQTTEQIRRFDSALAQLSNAHVRPRFVHLGNSSAVDEGSTLPWVKKVAGHLGCAALVRTGLALYGYTLRLDGPPGTVPHLQPRIEPVATWTTQVIGTRSLQAGDHVGYGASFTATRPMQVALLPTGYADGFRREASSGLGDGWVMIAGQRSPVVGRVSMNLTVVDISGHTVAPQVGAEAVLLGAGVTA